MEGLSAEREALWARIERASFLTQDEKRAAVGYGVLDGAGDSPAGSRPPAPFGGESAPFIKYNPDQPRVPAGNSDGGQWTDGGGGLGFGSGAASGSGSPSGRVRVAQARTGTMNDAGETERLVQLAQAAEEDWARYSVDLKEEEARGGHTLRYHIARNDAEALERLESRTLRTLTHTAYKKTNSTFDSIEAASDFINRVLEANKEQVDLVANGSLPESWITKRFGYTTGREAKRIGTFDNIVIRKTYNVGVQILHDQRSKKGYSVLTAYPFNENPE